MGGSQQPRVSLINPTFSTRTTTDGIGLFTGQIGYAWNAALLYVKGGAAVTSNRFNILDTLTGIESCLSQRDPLGRRRGCWIRVWLRTELVGRS